MSDFLEAAWTRSVGGLFDVVLSAQTFHMLNAGQLVPLYRQLTQILRPGGIFLCADHARSDSPAIQHAWELQRSEIEVRGVSQERDDWDGFWAAFSDALRVDHSEIRERLYGGRRSHKKERLPLVWHLTRMLESGFGSADCFWRHEYDAVYGGERSS